MQLQLEQEFENNLEIERVTTGDAEALEALEKKQKLDFEKIMQFRVRKNYSFS